MATAYIPGPTADAMRAARFTTQTRMKAPTLPTEPTPAEIDEAEAKLDRAYQKKLRERCEDYVKGVDRGAATMRPPRKTA